MIDGTKQLKSGYSTENGEEVGRPKLRWSDELRNWVGTAWQRATTDKETYAQERAAKSYNM